MIISTTAPGSLVQSWGQVTDYVDFLYAALWNDYAKWRHCVNLGLHGTVSSKGLECYRDCLQDHQDKTVTKLMNDCIFSLLWKVGYCIMAYSLFVFFHKSCENIPANHLFKMFNSFCPSDCQCCLWLKSTSCLTLSFELHSDGWGVEDLDLCPGASTRVWLTEKDWVHISWGLMVKIGVG